MSWGVLSRHWALIATLCAAGALFAASSEGWCCSRFARKLSVAAVRHAVAGGSLRGQPCYSHCLNCWRLKRLASIWDLLSCHKSPSWASAAAGWMTDSSWMLGAWSLAQHSAQPLWQAARCEATTARWASSLGRPSATAASITGFKVAMRKYIKWHFSCYVQLSWFDLRWCSECKERLVWVRIVRPHPCSWFAWVRQSVPVG